MTKYVLIEKDDETIKARLGGPQDSPERLAEIEAAYRRHGYQILEEEE